MHDVASTGAAGYDIDSGVRVLDLVAALLKELDPAKFAGLWVYPCLRHLGFRPLWPGSGVLVAPPGPFLYVPYSLTYMDDCQ